MNYKITNLVTGKVIVVDTLRSKKYRIQKILFGEDNMIAEQTLEPLTVFFDAQAYKETANQRRSETLKGITQPRYSSIQGYTKEGVLKVEGTGRQLHDLGYDRGTVSRAFKSGEIRYGLYWKAIIKK